VEKATRYGPVIVVDDGSTDGSGEVAQQRGATVVTHSWRRGKGAALRTGFDAAIARGAAAIVTLDGDGQHDPDEIPLLLEGARRKSRAVVIGQRLRPSGVIPPGRMNAIRVAGFFINWLTRADVQDTQSGFRLYPARLIQEVRPRRGGFVLETELFLAAQRAGYEIQTVSVTTIHHPDRRSRFRALRDGTAIGGFLARRVLAGWGVEAWGAIRQLAEQFSAPVAHRRHRQLALETLPYRGALAQFSLAAGAFGLRWITTALRDLWSDPGVRQLRLVTRAILFSPLLGLLALLFPVTRRLSIDLLTPFVRRFYSTDRLTQLQRAARSDRDATDFDVLIVGGGPGGSTAATCLAQAGLRVACFERERFPRFHIGESLLPANLPLFDRIGVHDAMKKAGCLVKYGACFTDEQEGNSYTFYFAKDKPWPNFGYQVVRSEFDTILLRHAALQGAEVFEETAVEGVELSREKVTIAVRFPTGERRSVTGAFLVDASGRDAFLASALGRRERIPNLGKVALYAHFAGATRFPGLEEGHIRIYVFDGGWFWWIPFAGDVTSVGCVLHSRTVRGRDGSIEALFESMIPRCHHVADGLRDARRVSPVYRSANFSYLTAPAIGDRHVSVGDAVSFVDPIFSAGVFIAMQSAELASHAIVKAFRDGVFEARRFRGYLRQYRRGVAPFLTMMKKYYQPAFLEVFLNPRHRFGMLDAVTSVLAGGAFLSRPLGLRVRLWMVFAVAWINRWARSWRGRPIESRLEW